MVPASKTSEMGGLICFSIAIHIKECVSVNQEPFSLKMTSEYKKNKFFYISMSKITLLRYGQKMEYVVTLLMI